MKVTIDYTDDTRDTIIAEQEALGNRFVEDQRHFDGNHLIFENDIPEPPPPPPPRELAKEFDELKAKLRLARVIE